MFAKLVPHPLLTVLIVIVWILLNGVSWGAAVLGLILGIVVPRATSAFWPDRPLVKSPLTIVTYALIVLWDIVVANFQVAYLILFRRGDDLQSHFVTIPLDLRSPEAISALAGTITMTPGTVSATLSADGRALLVHCLETDDPEKTVAEIKARYETRLQRIFER
ncbi:Na+/H+ antiporter subunit E [Methyloceanibacter caenitepidi]|uniref:Na(+) H(+) antiporter subunit E n=1 Tax=Methyloceanibacter caenitepidi TaxID=1384459 RepID=A0A0A8K5P0_9HYPH|nr:Na+/H+ antiporter subunit E [Methyloceanibacter caenitepidi]BAQ17832.1 Na(+) H(+) antiporter subunit E [Methyloceanibacter caenitepidi]